MLKNTMQVRPIVANNRINAPIGIIDYNKIKI